MKMYSHVLVFTDVNTGLELHGEKVSGMFDSQVRAYAEQRRAQVGSLLGKEVEVEIKESSFDIVDVL